MTPRADGSDRLAPKVLVVEDVAPDAERAREVLERSRDRFEVVVARTGAEALERLVGDAFDLLVIDYGLPDANGLDLLGRCRDRGVDAPAIILTGRGSERIAAEALRAGVAEYLVKERRSWQLLPLVAAGVLVRDGEARRLTQIETFMLDVSSSLDTEEMAQRIARAGTRLLAGTAAAVWRAGTRAILATDGPDAGVFRYHRADLDRLEGQVDGQWMSFPYVAVRELRSERDRTMGYLAVGLSERRVLSREEERALSVFGRFAGTALENASFLARERAYATQLEELDRLKSEFLSRVSHELLTPLTVIDGFARTVTERWDDLAEDERRNYLGCILPHTGELSQLIQRLLRFSALERPETPSMVVAVGVADTLRTVLERLETDRVEVDVGDEEVAATPEALFWIMDGLVSNALKFSPPAAPVLVSATSDGDRVTIRVDDEGPGVPEEEHDLVFHRFYRGRSAGEQRGAGMGLAIVRRYAECYSGDAWVESAPGGGASFRVRLPAADAAVPDDSRENALVEGDR